MKYIWRQAPPMDVALNLVAYGDVYDPSYLICGLTKKSPYPWDIGIVDARIRSTAGTKWVEIEVPKPVRRRAGDVSNFKTFRLDGEGLYLLLLYALAGARVEVVAAGRGDSVYHYLAVKFEKHRAMDFQRLIIAAEPDQFAMMNPRDHHELRRAFLGGVSAVQTERVFRNRADLETIAIEAFKHCPLSFLMDVERYAALLSSAYKELDEIPLGVTPA